MHGVTMLAFSHQGVQHRLGGAKPSDGAEHPASSRARIQGERILLYLVTGSWYGGGSADTSGGKAMQQEVTEVV